MNMFKRKQSTLLDKQIEVWIAWEIQNKPSASYQNDYEQWVRRFAKFTSKTSIWDVDDRDTEDFLKYIQQNYNGQFPLIKARIALNSICKYYAARGKNVMRMSYA